MRSIHVYIILYTKYMLQRARSRYVYVCHKAITPYLFSVCKTTLLRYPLEPFNHVKEQVAGANDTGKGLFWSYKYCTHTLMKPTC